MSQTDQLIDNAKAYAQGFDKGDLPLPPGKRVAVLACMDARLNPYGILGLEEGDAHVIRNAGGVVSEDAIRSLAISQNLLGTEEIVLIHHTDNVRGFVYEVDTGELHEVSRQPALRS
jgi:carbonic anhydrase